MTTTSPHHVNVSCLDDADAAPRIAGPYLLVINIPAQENGRLVEVPELWAKDLDRHLAVIGELVLACPVERDATAYGKQAVRHVAPVGDFALFGLPHPSSTFAALVALPRTVVRLWPAVGRARIVQCGVSGWPIPLGWVATAIAVLRRRFLIVAVESTHWRHLGEPRPAVKQRVRSFVFERMARWCARRADLVFYTHRGYLRDFPPSDPNIGHVIPASWIDSQQIRTMAEIRVDWQSKSSAQVPFRAIFAAGLTREKGIPVLLRAAELLRDRGTPFVLEIFGDGDLRVVCEQALHTSRGAVRYCGTLPYGERFFAALRKGHVVVVPSLSDEQPRVVYDAYSQGVPVLASDTPGLRECVQDGVTGLLVPPGDPQALAEALQRLAADRGLLTRLALESVRAAESFTHADMHNRRAGIIERAMIGRPALR